MSAELEQELESVASDEPQYWSDEVETSTFYRDAPYWKTEEDYVAIEDMGTEHLIRARRHAMRKAGEHMKQQGELYKQIAMHEAKAELFLLKMHQMKQELERRQVKDANYQET